MNNISLLLLVFIYVSISISSSSSSLSINYNQPTYTKMKSSSLTSSSSSSSSLPSTLLIFLHGSGGNGQELRTFLDVVTLSDFANRSFRNVADMSNIQYITPTAPYQPYIPNFRQPMHVWFNRTSRFIELGVDDDEDYIGTENSLELIMNIIIESGSKYDNVYLGGFSMGGGLVLHFLRKQLPNNVKGIFTMGSFLVNESAVFNSNNNLNNIPVFMMHGMNDSLIPIDWGRKTASNLILREVDVQFKEYQGLDHELGTDELVALLHWIEDTNKNPDKDQKRSNITKKNNETIDTCPVSIARRMDENNNIIDEDGSNNNEYDDGVTPRENNPSPLSYSIKVIDKSSSSVRIVYHVPEDTYELLLTRPVLACGGSFELKIDPDCNGIYTDAITNDPNHTAIEIAKRLVFRLNDEGGNLNPCPMA